MIIQNTKPFNGQHCELTATGTLLHQIGIHLSEPMLFGLGEGLSFIFWNMKGMDFPFIGGRIKPDVLTQNIAKTLKLTLEAKETSSIQKAWTMVKKRIDNDIIVGLKLDCFHLEYFTERFHFAAHYAAIYGYDATFAYLVDTIQQNSLVKTSLKSLELARNEKGPMSSKNLFYTIGKSDENYSMHEAIVNAIRNNASEYLNSPINNIGYKGILKLSKEIKKWFNTSNTIERDFCSTAKLMEKGGTGGAIFRNFYRDFLRESYDLLKIDIVKSAYLEFALIAEQWTIIASLFDQAGKEKEIKYIDQASEILKALSEKEKKAMELLSTI